MVFVITFFMLSLFSVFFYLIWLWYLALLPIAVFVFMLSHWIKNIFKWMKFEILWEKRSLILIWLITMVWVSWILFFVWIKEISVYLTLLILNIFLWLWSHVFKYDDGKLIFEIGTWIMVVVVLWTSLISWWFYTFCEAWSLLACLMLAVYSFLQFVIGIFYPTEEIRSYEIAILATIVIWGWVLWYFYPSGCVAPIWLFILLLLFLGISIVQNREMPSKQTTKISVRRILAWERIFKKLNIPSRKISVYNWLENEPKRFPYVFEFINLGLLVFLLLSSFRWIFTSSTINLGVWYRSWISLFLINIFLLKRIWYASDVSRFALALIVNFILYSVLLISWSTIESILPFLIVWWFLCQIAIFYVDRINITFFTEKDYLYWTVVTFIASVCNIILLCNVDLPKQFLFSLIFVYVWVELMLLYYIVRFLNDRQDKIDNIELEEKESIKELVDSDINDN